MKKILVVTYFWPPSGKATVHWPLFIIKHLPKYGWHASVLTVEKDTFSHGDESLLKEVDPSTEVIRTPAHDPFALYRKFLGKGKDSPLVASETISLENKGFRHRLAIWIRMNLFIPDARVGWMYSAVPAGRSLLRSRHFDAIVSIGPPHSSHLIAKRLSIEFGLPHIPVFIDPWTDIVYYSGFKRNRITHAIDTHLERKVLRHAAKAVFVTVETMNAYRQKYPWLQTKSEILYWGYNEEYFSRALPRKNPDEQIILHAGNIFDYQNPKGFWKTVAREQQKGRPFKIKFAGTVGPLMKKEIEENGLQEITEYLGFLPYDKVVAEMLSASYLLVCATERRHLPGKLFEYLRTGNRIIAFGDDNAEIENILHRANAGLLFPYQYSGTDYFEKVDMCTPNPESGLQYSRENIAGQLGSILTASQSPR